MGNNIDIWMFSHTYIEFYKKVFYNSVRFKNEVLLMSATTDDEDSSDNLLKLWNKKKNINIVKME